MTTISKAQGQIHIQVRSKNKEQFLNWGLNYVQVQSSGARSQAKIQYSGQVQLSYPYMRPQSLPILASHSFTIYNLTHTYLLLSTSLTIKFHPYIHYLLLNPLPIPTCYLHSTLQQLITYPYFITIN